MVAVGEGKYDVTGSGGEPLRIKADGVLIDSPFGGKVSFKKLSDRKWVMVRKGEEDMLRTYTVSADDKTLQLYDLFSQANGEKSSTTTTYARTSPGKGILGSWKSVSMTETDPKSGYQMEVTATGKNAITFNSPADKHPMTYWFDGKPHLDTEQSSDAQKGMTSTATRVDVHTILIESKVNGQVDETSELKVSADGKTLTNTSKAMKSGTLFTAYFDRQ